MAHNFNSGFFVKEPAWHKLGTVIPEHVEASQAIIMAGQDWAVENRPCFDENGNELPSFIRRIVRADNGKTLGRCAEMYKPIQNREIYDMAQAIVSQGVRFETAGVLKNGQYVWALINAGVNQVKDDKTQTYMLLYNWHNAGGAMKVLMTDVRVVCWNTLSMHFGRENSNTISIHHTGEIGKKIEQAKHIMAKAGQWREKFVDVVNALAEVEVRKDFAEHVAKKAYPEKFNKYHQDVNAEHRYAIVETFLMQSKQCIAAVDGTAWGLVNAFTEYVDHELKAPSRNMLRNDSVHAGERQMMSCLMPMGSGYKIKEQALETIIEESTKELDAKFPAWASQN
jgi:phage/plasmid-like protein (TIGR03299 family)